MEGILLCVLSERNILIELRTVVDTLIVPDPRAALITLASRYLNTLEQHKELACIMLREFRSHPEVAAEFHELHEENIRFIASYVQKTFKAGQYEPVKNIEAIARMFLYNIIVIGIIEDLPEPLHFVENMVDVLLPDLVKKA